MIIEFDIDFTGHRTFDLFAITPKRCDELIKHVADISFEITENYKDYSFDYIEDGKQKEGMNQGKIMQRFLRDFDNSQEKVFLMVLYGNTLEIMQRTVAIKNAVAAQQRLFNRKFEKNDTN